MVESQWMKSNHHVQNAKVTMLHRYFGDILQILMKKWKNELREKRLSWEDVLLQTMIQIGNAMNVTIDGENEKIESMRQKRNHERFKGIRKLKNISSRWIMRH